jgi:uncharacterized integral membrane protein (TIGR00697 family)
MKKNEKNLILLIVMFVTSLLTANIISSNGMIITGIFITKDIQLLAPGAVLAYAITFLCTDIIGQIWGKKEANRAVIYGFIAQILCTGLIFFTPIIFNKWFIGSEVYSALNSLGWFTLGSLVAYCLSQTWDVFIFHKIKDWAKNKFGEEKYNKQRWLWNNGSTMTSQIIDTVIFIGIGFGIGMGMRGNELIGLMIGQYLVKFVLALLDTPFFYLLTRTSKEKTKIKN